MMFFDPVPKNIRKHHLALEREILSSIPISQSKKNKTATYELKLPSDKLFTQIHGEVKLIYTVHEKEKVVMLETLTPEDILLEGHRSELTTYKGIMISKENASKDMFKIDLLNMMQGK